MIGAWALGLPVSSSVQIYATDLSAQNFPPPNSTPANFHLHIASSTRFPPEWSNKFDYVHQRFLIAALRVEEWPIAMSEIFRVSKPGCAVQLVESRPPTPKAPAMEKLSNLAIGLFEKTGLPVGKKWGDAGVQNAKTMRSGLENVGPAFEKFGLIQSLTEYSVILDEMEKEWDEHGSEFECRLVTARKPPRVDDR